VRKFIKESNSGVEIVFDQGVPTENHRFNWWRGHARFQVLAAAGAKVRVGFWNPATDTISGSGNEQSFGCSVGLLICDSITGWVKLYHDAFRAMTRFTYGCRGRKSAPLMTPAPFFVAPPIAPVRNPGRPMPVPLMMLKLEHSPICPRKL
jgi:hypothetical protein